jgi:hypothetical protein
MLRRLFPLSDLPRVTLAEEEAGPRIKSGVTMDDGFR